MIWKKLNAGALQFTMYVVVVVAVLLAGFILFVHTHKTLELHKGLTKDAVSQAHKGIHSILTQTIPLGDTIRIPIENDIETYGSLTLHRNYWGIYETATAISKLKNKTFKALGLVGGQETSIEPTALYLADKNRPLVVVGNAHIEGLNYIPKQGVRTGNISGHSYYGKQLLYGNSKTSKPALPSFSPEFLQQVQHIQKHTLQTVQDSQFIDLNASKTHRNSFFRPLKVLYSTNAINLSGIALTGHIKVQSQSKIIVDATTKLTDVILMAPEIEIRSNVSGTFQAFATKTIHVGSSCTLKYPSALVVVKTSNVNPASNTTKEPPAIVVSKASKVAGIVAFMGQDKRYTAHVFIDEAAEVVGEVYCQRNFELLGTVRGSVFAEHLVANQSGSVYQNHLYNGKILGTALSQEYAGLPFKGAKKRVVKWLY